MPQPPLPRKLFVIEANKADIMAAVAPAPTHESRGNISDFIEFEAAKETNMDRKSEYSYHAVLFHVYGDIAMILGRSPLRTRFRNSLATQSLGVRCNHEQAHSINNLQLV